MGGAVYNSGIPSARLNSVCRLFPRRPLPSFLRTSSVSWPVFYFARTGDHRGRD